MTRGKILYVSEATHRRLKIIAARRNRSMGQVVEDLVDREAEELENIWLSPAGLDMQDQVLRDAWEDPALDVYDSD
jgi:hypothetical protein